MSDSLTGKAVASSSNVTAVPGFTFFTTISRQEKISRPAVPSLGVGLSFDKYKSTCPLKGCLKVLSAKLTLIICANEKAATESTSVRVRKIFFIPEDNYKMYSKDVTIPIKTF